MKRIGVLLGAAIWLSAAQLNAQVADDSPFAADAPQPPPYQSAPIITEAESPELHVSWGQLQPTAEMWLYEQRKEDYNDPRQAVRRKAAAKTAQRQARIASMKWYGMSNSRPYANPTPVCGTYSPGWASGNYQPYQWTNGYPLLVSRPASVQFDLTYGLW